MIEIETIRSGAGWFRRPDRALVTVRGKDRVTFLNGQLSQDIQALAEEGPGAGAYGFALTSQGRIVADLHILLHEDEIWLECERTRTDALIERLKRYLVADDVELRDESARYTRFAIEGPAAREMLDDDGIPTLGHHCLASVDNLHFRVAAYGLTGYPALQLFVDPDQADHLERTLLERRLARGLVPATAETLDVLRVEAGIPESRSELGEDVLPAESGVLERAVSFSKGCYTGQEVVARMESRGRASHRLVGIQIAAGSDGPVVGRTLHKESRKVGEITSAARSPLYGHIALAFVRDAHSEAGTSLTFEDGTGKLTVTVLPFRAQHDA